MKYIETIVFPDQSLIQAYMDNNAICYPWNIFSKNQFQWMICKDITILYGNNGSGKSTILNLIASKIKAQRNSELFNDILYIDGRQLNPFDDLVNETKLKLNIDENEHEIVLPSNRKIITSNDLFKRIEERTKRNNRILVEIKDAIEKQKDLVNKGYKYKTMADYDDLVSLIEARKLSLRKYLEVHASTKQQMQSNGETVIDIYSKAFETGGIYLLDEPENCLSPIFQIELIKIIQDSVRYFDCQFIICTHSPLLLSLKNAIIYDLDNRPVIDKEWSDLENVKIYYDFFKRHKENFE